MAFVALLATSGCGPFGSSASPEASTTDQTACDGGSGTAFSQYGARWPGTYEGCLSASGDSLTVTNTSPDQGNPYVYLVSGPDAKFPKPTDEEFKYDWLKSPGDNLSDEISSKVVDYFPEVRSGRATIAPGQTLTVTSLDGAPLHLAISVDVYGTDVNKVAQLMADETFELLNSNEDTEAANNISGCLNAVRDQLYESHNSDPDLGTISKFLTSVKQYKGGDSCLEAFHFIFSGGESGAVEPSEEQKLTGEVESAVSELEVKPKKAEKLWGELEEAARYAEKIAEEDR